MKQSIFISFLLLMFTFSYAQNDTTKVYKKRVLEHAEIDLLTSFYTQDGKNAAVTGGIGTEQLDDYATNITIAIPLNDDDVLSIDGTVSAYTSASSSNLNPFSGASSGGEDDDDEHFIKQQNTEPVTGTPWVASSGASKQDVWINANIGYSHSSDNRNNIYSAHVSFANEFDYTSFGAGAGYTKLFNQKNTELGIKTNLFFDVWKPQYPTEIKEFIYGNGDLNYGFFDSTDIYLSDGSVMDKYGTSTWSAFNNSLIKNKGRNTYSVSLSFSQILSKRAQVAIFSDIEVQQGWLSNPMQRVYFADRDNYYIGIASSIPNYTTTANKDVFQLADDIERLPHQRLKTPVGLRFNYYLNEFLVFRSYYRYYMDSWELTSHTVNIELPIKVSQKFSLYPSFRYYIQTQAKYFAPYEQHLSTEQYYTSDYDLSAFTALQYGFGIKYTDILTKAHISVLGLKNLSLDYSYYDRSTGLKASIFTFGAKFLIGN